MSDSLITYPPKNTKWNNVAFSISFYVCIAISFSVSCYCIFSSTPDYSIIKTHITTLPGIPMVKVIPLVVVCAFVFSLLFIYLIKVMTRLFIILFGVVFPVIFSVILIVLSILSFSRGIWTFVTLLVCGVSLLISPLIIFVSRKKLPITIDIVHLSSTALIQTKHILFVLCPLLLIVTTTVLLFVPGSVVLNYLSGTTKNDQYVPPKAFIPILLLQAFSLFWVLNTVSGVSVVITSSVISHKYLNTKDVGDSFMESVYNALTKKFGSIAFGSLILSVVQFIQFVVNYLDGDDDDPSVAQRILKCIFQYLLSLLETIVRYVNKMAYVIVGMHGTPFLESAHVAVDLVKNNLVTAILQDTVIGSICFGVILVGGIMCGSIGGVFVYVFGYGKVVSYITFIVSFIISIFVVSYFFALLQASTDTILLCYAEDLVLFNGVHCEKLNAIVSHYDKYEPFEAINTEQNDSQVVPQEHHNEQNF
ncbi:protein PNS1, putative [Entamoeba invadens IP1]|uniref:Choline transporter-like protein n=1 Tax=Entamoeba invadens IP1 TaxID=370355 RepID=A0A0A1U9I4_ENTIV|nr:protein PNS1, putative [Entamoeba invadens IP1]ELP91646.1 protein PNS1, putative [Entamoeba invadens IP1]|eukprot:XP_004258417.1 protein PNS1, putative [Entamoeba invadens IP1]